MLKLGGNIDLIQQIADIRNGLFTITTDPCLPPAIRNRFALLTDYPLSIKGYGAQLAGNQARSGDHARARLGRLSPSRDFNYLKNGDIVSIDGARPYLRTLFRKDSFHNSILLTEQCNNYCLMCSQPPKKGDDSYLLRRTFDLLSLIPKDAGRIGFTGGEPTLYGDGLIDLLKHAKLQLPNTSIDILSNGRRFKNEEFCRSLRGKLSIRIAP